MPSFPGRGAGSEGGGPAAPRGPLLVHLNLNTNQQLSAHFLPLGRNQESLQFFHFVLNAF